MTDHLDLTRLKGGELLDELVSDRETLQQYTDIPVVGHAFPYGRTSKAVEQVLKTEGFSYARGIKSEKAARQFAFPENLMNFKPTCWHIEDGVETLLDQFIAAEPIDGDMLFYIWGHGYEFDFPALKGLRDMYERMFDKVACHDEIIKCTNAEAFMNHKIDR